MESKLQKRMLGISVDNVKMKEVIIGMGKTEGVTVPHVAVNPFKKSFMKKKCNKRRESKFGGSEIWES